jgi:hypothetical protein
MKNTLILTLIIIFAGVVKTEAQMFYAVPRNHVAVVVEDNSYVKILGKTNVNSFSCDYRKEIPKDTIEVSIRQMGNMIVLENAILEVEVDGFDCGNQMMNKDFQNLLKENAHPKITLRIKSIEPSNGLTASSTNTGYAEIGYAMVEFEIAGVKNEYKVPLNSFEQVMSQYFLGQKTINITDFKLTPPRKFMGLVKVEEEISIDFRLNLNFLY